MITVDEDDSDRIFASDAFFERTGNFRKNLSECSCEELRDLCRYFITKAENAYGLAEQSADNLAEILGWKNIV